MTPHEGSPSTVEDGGAGSPPSPLGRAADGVLTGSARPRHAAAAPAWWVLADAQGNRVCLCTWQNRD